MELGIGEIILIVLILSLIFGVGWIFGLAGWTRKGIRRLREGLNAGEESSKDGGPDPAEMLSK
jgi:Sec-independent protein translocase protein TatA